MIEQKQISLKGKRKERSKRSSRNNTGFEKDDKTYAAEIKKKRGFYEHLVNTFNTLGEMEY